MKLIDNIKTEIVKSLAYDQYDIVEKDVINVLIQLMKMFLIFFRQKPKDPKNLIDRDEEEVKLLKQELIQFFIKKNYQKKEFKILKVEVFNSRSDSEYLKSLLENLYYYLNEYEFKTIFENFYYYLFHLIYFLLLSLLKMKDKNFLKEEIFKFYFFHIVRYFENDKKNPDKYFFFYHGAFKLLKKKFEIPTNFVINFDLNKFQFSMPNTIENIYKEYLFSLILKKSKDEGKEEDKNKCKEIKKFIDDEEINILRINKIIKEIKIKQSELFVNKIISNDNYNNNLVNYFDCIHKSIEKVKDLLDSYKLECSGLTKYNQLIENFQQLIIKHGITLNHLILMEINYQYQYGSIPNELDIEKYIKYAQIINKCEEDSDVDYTDIFTKIINSKKFNKLYTTSMKSSFIRSFAEHQNLSSKYNIFMNSFVNKISEYILFVPLTRGIKAYVSNYMRICLNINSVSISGYTDDELQNEYFTSYLLINLLHESFHFIYRLNEFGKTADLTKSPSNKKIREEYSKIGMDLILYLFGTEYIIFISKDNCALINDTKSWENEKTNFKVFPLIYLFDRELVGKKEADKILGSGLKCNILDFYETDKYDEKEFRLCTGGSIKYCY